MKNNIRLTLAGAEPLADFAKALRSSGEQLQTCISGISDSLEEPLKAKFLGVKAELQKMLAGIPAEIPKDENSLQLALGMLNTSQSINSYLSETATAAAKELQTTKASLTGEVEKAVTAKITSGELITKAVVETKISDATAAARTAAISEFTQKQKLVGERRQQLTTAKLAVPSDDILAKEEKDFVALKATAEKRLVELKPFGLAEDRILTLCWNTDEAAYAASLALVQDVTKGKPTGGNGFINREQAGAAPIGKSGLF